MYISKNMGRKELHSNPVHLYGPDWIIISMIKVKVNDPMSNFFDALKSDSAKRQYPKRLKYFFDSLEIEENDKFVPLCNIELNKQALEFMSHKNDKEYIESCFRHMLRVQKKRVETGEIQESTIYNYYKAAKVFCDQNGIDITWKRITRIIPTGRRAAVDRIPNEDEIHRLVSYPDRRIKAIVYTMLSSGIRIEGWNYLKWKHVSPMKREDGKLLGAKILVYAGDNEQYYSFITPEAYNYLESYINYRILHGEHVDGDSWVIRNTFESQIKKGSNVGKATEPRQLKDTGIKSLLERSANSEGLFSPLKEGEKRREWAVAHGLRKLFKTKCEISGMRSLHIEMLLGHNTGVTKSYYRPTESEILHDYQKAIPLLTIEEANKQVDKITTQIRNEMKGEVNNLRKEFMIYKFQAEENSYQEFIISKYERSGENISPVTPDIPKDFVKDALEDERKEDPNLTLEEMSFVKVKDIVNRLEPLNEKDKKVLNEYIKEEYGENEDWVCLIFSLPACIANMSDISPDEVRNKMKGLRINANN
jgi:integrase